MSEQIDLTDYTNSESEESSEWVEKRLGEIFGSIYSGGTPKKGVDEYYGGDIPFVKIEDLHEQQSGGVTTAENYITNQAIEETSTRAFGSRTLLMTIYGSLADTAIVQSRVATNQGILGLWDADEDNVLYVRYAIDNTQPQLASLSRQTTQANLGKGIVKKHKIPIPPLPEQRKIATVLYTVDRAIEKTEEVKDQLFKIRRGTIRELLTSGFPSGSGTETNIGPNEYCYPSDWEVMPLSKLIDIKSGEYFPAEDFCEDGIRCLKIDNVHYGRIIWENETHLPESYLDEYSDLVLDEGDILLALNRPITNNQIKVGMMDDSDAPALLYQRVGKLSPNERIRDEFLLYALSEGPFKHQLERRLVGSDQPYINKSQLRNIKIPVPPLQIQDDIVGHISSIDANFTTEKAIIERLNRIKRGLMQDLLSGTVRTTDTNIEVPEEIAQHG